MKRIIVRWKSYRALDDKKGTSERESLKAQPCFGSIITTDV